MDQTPTRTRVRRASATSWLLTVFMLICVGYFLFPLFWLVVASTKSNADLFSTFGLWFADFNLFENIKTVLTFQDGVFIRWVINSLDLRRRQRRRRRVPGHRGRLRVRQVRVPGRQRAVLHHPRRDHGPDHGPGRSRPTCSSPGPG